MSRRLTDKQIQEALDANPGFRLTPGITLDVKGKRCCPVGIVAYAATPLDRRPTLRVDWTPIIVSLGLSEAYRIGVIIGFDGDASPEVRPRQFSAEQHEEWREGHALGERWRKRRDAA